MKVTLIAFGNKKFAEAIDRFKSQAKSLNFFTNIYVLDEESLGKETDFIKDNYGFINSEVPGYGAWIWKSYIIEKAFEKFSNSDFFMYLDSGSEFNVNEKTIGRFTEYFNIADKVGLFAFRNRDQEANLSHCSVIDRIFPEAKHTLQFEANTLIFKNTKKNLSLIKEWKSLCIENNYWNVNPYSYKCCDLFGASLHDQSVLSCLLKREGYEGIPDEASWYLPSYSVYDTISSNRLKYPIFTARNPFNYSIINKDCLRYKEFSTCKHNDENFDCEQTLKVR